MPHERMFDDDDPALARVRGLATALPGVGEKISHGRPAFFTTKVLAYYGGSLKADGQWLQHPRSILVLTDPVDRDDLLARDTTFVPAYLGPTGWVGIDLPPLRGAEDDWAEVAELVDASYRLTAPARLVRALPPPGER